MSLRKLFFGVVFSLAVMSQAWCNSALEELPLSSKQVRGYGHANVATRHGAITLRYDNPKAGVKIHPPAGKKLWDWSGWKYLTVDIENTGSKTQLRMNMQLASKGDKDRYAVIGIALNPGEKRTLRMEIPHKFYDISPEGIPGPRYVDSDKIAYFEFFLQWPFEKGKKGLVDCRISNIRLEGKAVEPGKLNDDDFFPFVDRFGQYVHKDWPKKIRSADDLKNIHKAELAGLNASSRPKSWDRFGGWKDGPKLEATGNFRTEKYKGKWFLVDPDGRLFFSQGLDVLYPHTDATKVKGHEKWFEPKNIKGESINFTDNNLKLKYGKEDYFREFAKTLKKRMDVWGFNTIGDWGKGEYISLGNCAYTLQITDFQWDMPKLGKLKFYDVFDPKYINRMKTIIPDRIKKDPTLLKSLTDPLCIGYFIDNELRFGNWNHGYKNALMEEVIKCPEDQAIKKEFVSDLKLKYVTLDKLNKAWKTKYKDWSELLKSTEFPPETKSFKQDQKAFFRKAVEQYFRICNNTIKSVAPHRLYLGCRFLSTECSEEVVSEMSKKYCDVLTTNIYAHTPANLPTVAEGFPDMPVLIGEFHLGILDRGMFSPGLCLVGTTQEERAIAYKRFLQGALVHPNIVGAHWFQFRDQPLTGRWDGEGYNIGFVDVADTPYPELARAARAVGENMYDYISGGKLTEDF